METWIQLLINQKNYSFTRKEGFGLISQTKLTIYSMMAFFFYIADVN